MKKRISYVIYCILVVVPLLEGLLWLTGYRPYRYQKFSIVSEPSQSLSAHSTLGLALNPGTFEVIINDQIRYRATHSDSVSRYTYLAGKESYPTLAVFGCSYTYGMGVNDKETFSAVLNQLSKQYRVSTYAVPGYGTVQGFMQLQRQVKTGRKPAIALFNFADFHLDRNAMSPAYRLHLSIGYKLAISDTESEMAESNFPYVSLTGDRLHWHSEQWSQLYTHWQGRETFALINLLQTISDRYRTASIDKIRITTALFRDIRDFCRSHGISLVVAGMTQNESTKTVLQHLEQIQVNVADISLPLASAEYNHLPYDSHPNKYAHKRLATGLYNYLCFDKNLVIP
ncbi:MAG: hypothetical protein WBA74_08875 [Cyclobacteriaceae bacterium]